MEFLGIGPLELIFIFILILIIMGPEDMISTGRKMGEFVGKFLKSDFWQAMVSISREAKTIPNRLVREAGLKDLDNQIGSINPPTNEGNSPKPNKDPLNISSWVTPYNEEKPEIEETEPEQEVKPDN